MTYLRPSSSRSVNIRTVAAKRDRLHALMPAVQDPTNPLNVTPSNVKATLSRYMPFMDFEHRTPAARTLIQVVSKRFPQRI